MNHYSGTLTSPTSDHLRIGCIHRLMSFPYWATLAQAMNARAAELGIELCQPIDNADDEWEGAVDQVVRQRPNVAILPHSVTEAFPAVCQPFAAAGIPIVGVESEPSAQHASVVRADEAQGAAAVVAFLFERIGGQGKVANILAGNGLTKRQRQFHTALEQHPAIVLAYEGEGSWDRESGAAVMRAALLAHPDLCGVFAHNDQMAVGAIEVIAEQGLSDQIVVVGFDADPEGLIAIHEGRLAATVYRGLYRLGRTADSHVKIYPAVGNRRRHCRGNITVPDHAQGSAYAPDLVDNFLVPRTVEHHDNDILNAFVNRTRHDGRWHCVLVKIEREVAPDEERVVPRGTA